MAKAAPAARIPPATWLRGTRPARNPAMRGLPRPDRLRIRRRASPDRHTSGPHSVPGPALSQQAGLLPAANPMGRFHQDMPGTLTAYGTPWLEPAHTEAGSRPWGRQSRAALLLAEHDGSPNARSGSRRRWFLWLAHPALPVGPRP